LSILKKGDIEPLAEIFLRKKSPAAHRRGRYAAPGDRFPTINPVNILRGGDRHLQQESNLQHLRFVMAVPGAAMQEFQS
jgi:hypothetical protein